MLAPAPPRLRLEHDPVSVGKRYQLTAALPPSEAASVRRVPGVAAAAPRYTVRAADSFDLSQSFQVIAIPGDHTVLEAPPLASGRRLRGDGEAEVGTGLADAVGLGPGSTLAMQVPSGREVRFRVAGTVRALPDNGRV